MEFFIVDMNAHMCIGLVNGDPWEEDEKDEERMMESLRAFEKRTHSSFVTVESYAEDEFRFGYCEVTDTFGDLLPAVFLRNKED